MRLSQYFLPILREDPKEAEIVSHRLMLRAGMVRQESAGIYSWLPLGFRVLKKIEQIVREEQNRSGAIEVLMPTIQSADLWRARAAMTSTARRCCASPTATAATCCTGRPTRR
jgi:prolyl-tRNA synthetase